MYGVSTVWQCESPLEEDNNVWTIREYKDIDYKQLQSYTEIVLRVSHPHIISPYSVVIDRNNENVFYLLYDYEYVKYFYFICSIYLFYLFVLYLLNFYI